MSVAEQERPEKFWRDATAADVARVMEGATIEARFRDCASGEWKCRALVGWSRGGESDSFVWASTGLVHWRYCQVYDPPQWFRDKPNPGDEYRLLGKFPDEALQRGDEALGTNGKWSQSYQAKSSGVQVDCIWYRRKIEPVNPKFAVGQRVMVVRPKQKPSQHGGSDIDEFFGYADIVASVRENGEKLISYVLEGIDERAFPEDYLEPVVEPVELTLPGHPMCRCYVDPSILKPAQAEPNVLYPKIGDVIFLPEVGRVRVTARGFEIC